MTTPPSISIVELDLDAIASATGRVALFINAEGKMDPSARRVNKLSKGGVQRVLGSKAFEKLKSGGVISLAFPPQMEAKAIDIVKLERRPSVAEARKAERTMCYSLRVRPQRLRKSVWGTLCGPMTSRITKPQKTRLRAL